jgi:hypothetical protein
MKIKNFSGVAINVLLVLAGLAFIIIPAWCFFSYADDFFNTWDFTKEAIANVFYKGATVNFGSDLVPVLDPAIEKADLPAQVTPELVTKIVTAQAAVDNYWFQARSFPILALMFFGLFCAIGIVAILLGISLFLMWRKLNALSGEKNPVKGANKETKNKSIIYSNGKPRWKLIAAILVATVLVGAGLVAIIRHINDFPQTKISYSGEVVGEHDGECDASVDLVCDPDCPPDVDPDCTNPPAQELKTNQQTYKNDQFGFGMKYPAGWTINSGVNAAGELSTSLMSNGYQEQDSKLYQEAVDRNEEVGLLHKKILARGTTIFIQTTTIPADVNWCVATGQKKQGPCDWRDWAQRATDWPYGSLVSEGFSKIGGRDVFLREIKYPENDIVYDTVAFASPEGNKLYELALTGFEADKQANLKIMDDIVSSFVFVGSQPNSVSELKVYKSDKFGFEFQYTANAYQGLSIVGIDDQDNGVIFGNHYVVVADSKGQTIADYISKEYPSKCAADNMDLAQKAGCENFSITQKDILVGDSIKATEVQSRVVGAGREAFATYFLKDNKIYSIGYEAKSPYFWPQLYGEMIKTFKFTN